jgi:zinc/manganese transport system substrate-binding protein|nr:metal ABC transporter substrate-binding protein [Candidatus Krumholzibacteria bacterium]
MNKHLKLIAVLVLLTLPVTAQAKLKVVATLEDLGWIAQQVGGPEVEVQVLCPGHRDPHSMPAKPSLARKLGKADLLIYNGLELEVGWLPVLVDAARNPHIKAGQLGELNCSLALVHDEVVDVPQGEVDRSGGDIHPLGNPHYTLDPRLGMKIGHLIAHRLADLDPERAEDYAHRADDLDHQILDRVEAWEKRVADLQLDGVIVYHQQWEYLAHWLELEILAVVENRPGIAPSPRHVEDVIQRGRAAGRIALLAATWDHKDGANHVARKVPCPLVVVPASSGTDEAPGYLDLFERIVAGLESGRP